MRKKIKELYEHSTLVAKIRYSYLCLLVPFVLFLIFCFYNLWNNNRRYEDMINSSVMASQFSLDFQKDFDYETYLLIVGNKTLEESSLHDMLVEADDIVAGLEELTESQENLKRLTSVKKYLNNLETYIGRIEDNIREGNRYEDNMEIWENDVQIVTSLVGDTMSQYIYYEIRGIQESRQQYQDFFVNMIRFSIIAFTLILVLFLFLSYYIPLSITSPIRRLTQVTDQVAKGDLTVRSDVTGGVEAQVLSDSLNTMIDKINELLEQVKTEQIRLRKAEFELLQSQINPHFLYNTLDAIVWLAEAGEQKKVVSMVGSLSDFFRISLNQGQDILDVKEELQHVRSYLCSGRIKPLPDSQDHAAASGGKCTVPRNQEQTWQGHDTDRRRTGRRGLHSVDHGQRQGDDAGAAGAGEERHPQPEGPGDRYLRPVQCERTYPSEFR